MTPLKKVIFQLEGLALWIVFGFLKSLSLEKASDFGGWLGRTFGPLLSKSKRVQNNLDLYLQDVPPDVRAKIPLDMWDNLGRLAAEYGHLPYLQEHFQDYIEVVGLEHLLSLRDDNKPGILFSAHLGNWEIATLTALLNNLPLSIVYRPANNPYVNTQIRAAQGDLKTHLIPKGTAGAKEILKTLAQGGHIFMMVDQKFHTGIQVPFFGVPAWTAPAAARMALRFDCPLVPVQVERLGKSPKFRVTFYPPLDMPPYDESLGLPKDHPDYVYPVMVRVNQIIEFWVRKNPAQWLWIHRRWE